MKAVFRRALALAGGKLPLLTVSMLVQSGCGNSDTAKVQLSDLDTQIFEQTIHALATGRPEDSLSKIDRLKGLYPRATFLHLASEHEQRRQAMLALNKRVVNGEINSARTLAEDQSVLLSGDTSYRRIISHLNALDTLHSYISQRPYSEAATARTALLKLQKHEETLSTIPDYNAWFKRQKRIIAQRAAVEQKQSMRQLIYSLDVAAMGGKDQVSLMLAVLVTDLPEAEDSPTKSLKSAIADVTGRAPLAMQDHGLGIAFEHEVSQPSGSGTPGASSALLEAVRQVRRGKAHQAVALLKKLPLRHHGIAPVAHAVLLRRLLLPEEQYHAACWRTPFPGVPDYLARLIQLHQYQINTKRHPPDYE